MDDLNSNTDTNRDVEALFMGTIPERGEEVAEIMKQVQFERADDRPALHFEANAFFGRGLVIFTDRSMQQMWLIAYLSWKTLSEQSGFVIVLLAESKPYDSALNDKHDQYVSYVDRLGEALTDLRTADANQTLPWPEDVPRLDPELSELDGDEDHVTYHLGLFASTFVFLHEVSHTQRRMNGEEYGGIPEELNCDAYAINLLLDQCKVYADQNNDDPALVYRKRAMGVLLGLATIFESTELGVWYPSDSHPSIYERISQLYDIVVQHITDDDDDFWLFGSCVLLSKARRDKKLPQFIEFDSVHYLFLEVLDLFKHAE